MDFYDENKELLTQLLGKNIKVISEIDRFSLRENKNNLDQTLEGLYANYTTKENIRVHLDELDLNNQVNRWNIRQPVRVGLNHEPADRLTKSGYALVFGVGTGENLNELIKNKNIYQLVIVESDIEKFQQSFTLSSWSKFILQLEKRGILLRLYLDKKPEIAGLFAIQQLSNKYQCLLDGSYIFYDAKSKYIDDYKIMIRQYLPILGEIKGSFEDQLRMMKNVFTNIERYSFRKMPHAPKSLADIPAIIVGSGPSLDDSIEFISENQDNALIFACGTSLASLLGHGIKPDILTLYEINHLNEEFISLLAAEHDLSDITLIAPATVDPIVSERFDTVCFYFPSEASVSVLVSDKKGIISNSGSTVTNVAVRACISLGISNIYLFGVDLGAKETGNHHSKSSLYYSDIAENDHKGKSEYWREIAQRDPFCWPVIGVNGERMRTSKYLLRAKMDYEFLTLLYPDVCFYNCSNMVKIRGMIDVDFTKLQLQRINKKSISFGLMAEWERLPKEDYFFENRLNIEDVRSYLSFTIDQIQNINLKKIGWQFHEFCQKVMGIFTRKQVAKINQEIVSFCQKLLIGSVVKFLQLGNYYKSKLKIGNWQKFFTDMKESLVSLLVSYNRLVDNFFLSHFDKS